MFKNYLKIAIRHFFKKKMYSFINILGLSVGMACFLLIVLYIGVESSYDNYHKDADRIYRIGIDIDTPAYKQTFAPISFFMAPYLRENFPQVEDVTRIRGLGSVLVRRGERTFYENTMVRADNSIFSVLTFPFLNGDANTALIRPGTLVLSETMAHKYFGTENPMGKSLRIDSNDFVVTGVIADPPRNTHLKFGIIASMIGNDVPEWMKQHWDLNVLYTYVKFRPGTDVEKLLPMIEEGANVHREIKEGEKYTYFLQPLKDIHLFSHVAGELDPPGNPTFLLICGVIGALILIIASINFINLSTARAAERAREVGMRKIVGAYRKQLIFQFLGESLLTTLQAVVLGGLLVTVSLPLYSRLTEMPFTQKDLFGLDILLFLAGIILFSGVVAGSYPAFFLSAFRPVSLLKGNQKTGSKGLGLRRILVVGQFTVSLVLISATIVISQQVRFMKKQNLGFYKKQKIVIPVRSGASIRENFETVKSEFKKMKSITGVSVSSGVPGRLPNGANVQLVGEAESHSQWMYYLFVDPEFLREYKISTIAGRAFEKERISDSSPTFMINETAVKKFGWSEPEEAIGKTLRSGYGGSQGKIIGVAKDFHFTGLQQEIGPLVMFIYPSQYRYVTLSVSAENIGQTISLVKSTWESLFPGIPFDYFFLDNDFDRFYRQEEKTGLLVRVFGILAIFIACLGILGLAATTAQKRTKEIGVRKVLGASSTKIMVQLTSDFLKRFITANIIAWPLTFVILNRWLQGFAYRTGFSFWFLLIPSGVTLGMAVLAVSFHTVRAANADPVKSLRYE